MPMTEKEVANYPDEMLRADLCHLLVARKFASDHRAADGLPTIEVLPGDPAVWAWNYPTKRLRQMLRSGSLSLEPGTLPTKLAERAGELLEIEAGLIADAAAEKAEGDEKAAAEVTKAEDARAELESNAKASAAGEAKPKKGAKKRAG